MELNETQRAALQAAAAILAGNANFEDLSVTAVQCVTLAEEILKALEARSGDVSSPYDTSTSFFTV